MDNHNTRSRRLIRTLFPMLSLTLAAGNACVEARAGEAPTGFDNLTNGYLPQTLFDGDARRLFEHVQTIEDGHGPVYNARSCVECHGSPVTAGSSQISQIRAGHWDGEKFSPPSDGTLIRDRATDAAIQSHVGAHLNVRSIRIAPAALGDGFVEAIADETLLKIAKQQPGQSGGAIHGEAILVDVLEASGVKRIGRFGWKDTHGSLISFTAEAARDEMGITSSFLPDEATSNGRPVDAYDTVPDPEDRGLVLYGAQFVRSTKAPPRDAAIAATSAARKGEELFGKIGCGICHTPSITTAPAGTIINGGRFQIPDALGGKTIHPYSDYLLHDVGTGDGIVQNGGPSTRNKLRTAPLWGLRTHARLLHDGSALTLDEAISRHQGEASGVTKAFKALSADQKRQLLRFLSSL